MKRAWIVMAFAGLLASGCDMKVGKKPGTNVNGDAPPPSGDTPIRVVENEGPHVLVKAGDGLNEVIKRPKLAVVRITRNGTIEPSQVIFTGETVYVSQAGAATSGNCCKAEDPPEIRSMAGTFVGLRDSVQAGADGSCEEPVLLDGDHKASWSRIRMLLISMARAKMSKLVFATNCDLPKYKDLRGFAIKLPTPWDTTVAPPADATVIVVNAKLKELELTIGTTVCKDVPSAVAALKAAGAKKVTIRATDDKTPLWAVEKAAEAASLVSDGGPIWFDLAGH